MEYARPTSPKPFVFVLMPFEQKYKNVYEYGIKGAAEDAGGHAERLDEQLFVEGMLDRIFTQISKADVLVADMSDRNPNVFYEVGYAHALNKIVLLLTHNPDDIPFDLKHYPHTVYNADDISALRSSLAPKIEWAIAEALNKKAGVWPERFGLVIFKKEIPEGLPLNEAIVISAKARGRIFNQGFFVRNDSLVESSQVDHIYMFTEPDAKMVPLDRDDKTLSAFAVAVADKSDNLTTMYKLPQSVPRLPPGAIDVLTVRFRLTGAAQTVTTALRLRLHTASRAHDFAVRWIQEVKSPPKETAAPQQ